MKKAIPLMFFLLSVAFASANINVDKTEWKFNYNIGDSTPSQVFVFTNTENVSKDVALIGSIEGMTFDFHGLSSFTVPANGEKSILVTMNIPSTIPEGKKTGLIFISTSVTVNDPSISVEANVTKPGATVECTKDSDCTTSRVCKENKCVTKCRIEPLSTEVERIFKVNSEVSTEKFYIYISKGCEGAPVEFKSAEFTGTIQTDQGKKPVRLSAKQLIAKEYNEEPAEFEVTYDVVGVDPKVYNPTLNVLARYGDNTLTAAIKFNVIVAGSVTPISNPNELKAPTYTVPAQIRSGELFEIKATDVNPNIQPEIFFNDKLIGHSVERKETTWTWKGYVNESGTCTVKIASMYNGGPIGAIFSKDISVVDVIGATPMGNLTFECHPAISELKGGELVSVLIRDKNNIIPDAILYVNGVREDDKQFTFEAGKKYQLSATHSNYLTADMMVEVTKKDILISINPEDIEEGEQGMVSASGSGGESLGNATITYDGIVVRSGTFTSGTIGTHTIKAIADGFNDKTIQIDVKPATMMLQAPEEVSRKKEVVITLSKAAPWYVQWNSNDEKKPETNRVNQGASNQVLFTPDKNGVYQVYVRNRLIKNYELRGFSFGEFKWSWWYLVVIAIIIVVIIIIAANSRGGSGGRRRVGYGLPGGGDIVTPLG